MDESLDYPRSKDVVLVLTIMVAMFMVKVVMLKLMVVLVVAADENDERVDGDYIRQNF